jgi:NADH-quinone oxidoreductase subunit C
MTQTRPTGAGPASATPDMATGEHAKLLDAAADVQLDERLVRLRDHIVETFPPLETIDFRGELTLITEPAQRIDLLTFCRDDPDVRCELLADLSGVHWPAGTRVENAQETTGWPTYETDQGPGRIEVNYILRSIAHNHWFRIRVNTPDDNPVLPSATAVYSSANVMERETYDFFGVCFEGHPNLVRILMPDDWEGHPHRKDYPLGGVEVMYKGKTVPPPDERYY